MSMSYTHIKVPAQGKAIQIRNNRLEVGDNPIIPYIEGDGIGPDIWKAAQKVVDAAVAKIYGGKRAIHWMEIYAGEKAHSLYGEYLPEETIQAIKDYIVAIKGPLTTPVGGGIRSLNVSIRQILDLYACVRPVRHYRGTPSPVYHPEDVNVVIFRENTEDVYSGIEWKKGSPEAEKIINYLRQEFGKEIRPDSGIGIKPISVFATQRLMRKAVQYALDNKRSSVTIIHKGNIMKFTEGAFKDWCYELALSEFRDRIVTESELYDELDGKVPAGKIVIKDRIADAMFQQLLLRPAEYDVLVSPNLNGDYISDAAAAQVGGLGMAPGSNVADHLAVFEATHGTAPKYAGQDKVNPGSLILSAVMMLEYMGWKEAGQAVEEALSRTIEAKAVTYDLARQIEGATELKTSQFADEIITRL